MTFRGVSRDDADTEDTTVWPITASLLPCALLLLVAFWGVVTVGSSSPNGPDATTARHLYGLAVVAMSVLTAAAIVWIHRTVRYDRVARRIAPLLALVLVVGLSVGSYRLFLMSVRSICACGGV